MDNAVLKKLRYKQGRAIVINAPDGYALAIETEQELQGKFDFVQLFALNAQDVNDWAPKIIPTLNEEALFWISYPKQTSKMKTDINRDIVWKMIESTTEYRLVSNIAIDETWSALRFRHQDKFKK